MPSPWPASALSLTMGGLAIVVGALMCGLVPLLSRLTGRPRIRTGLVLSAVAILVGLTAYLACIRAGEWWAGCGLGFAAACLTAMAAIDARWLVIPDLHVILLMVLALIGPLAPGIGATILGAILGSGLLWVVRALFLRLKGIEAMGLGDVKLMAAVGALVGPFRVLWIIVAASILGVVWGLIRSRGRLAAAPPAPFGAMAALPALAVLAWSNLGVAG